MNDMLKDKNVLYIMMICYCNKIITNAEMNKYIIMYLKQ